MSTSVAVLTPVLARPHRVAPLVESILAAARFVPCRPVFLCTPGDAAEIAAVQAAEAEHPEVELIVVGWPSGPGDYALKINLGAQAVADEWLFTGADDLDYRPGWAERTLACHLETRACVVGTNDGGNRLTADGRHSTHTLVHRDYLECGTVDEPESGKLLHEHYGHMFCNPPEAPVWMADLSFKRIGDIQVGDRVIGWERTQIARPTVGTPRRSLCYADVTNIAARRAPLVKVTMQSGRSFRCTPDHRWLNSYWSPSTRYGSEWITPAVGRSLLHVIDYRHVYDWTLEQQRDVGWLAGIYDGEGSGIYLASQSLKNATVVSEIDRVLADLGIPHNRKVGKSKMVQWVLSGGRQSYLDFLLAVRPMRRSSLAPCIVGFRWRSRRSGRGPRAEIGVRRFGHRDRIVAVEEIAGEHEVVSMTTTSGNYVAWGYASRNCDTEFVGTAKARETYAHAADAVVAHQHPFWGTAKPDATYRKGQESAASDRRLFQARRALWEAL
jgi:hypothetical protein